MRKPVHLGHCGPKVPCNNTEDGRIPPWGMKSPSEVTRLRNVEAVRWNSPSFEASARLSLAMADTLRAEDPQLDLEPPHLADAERCRDGQPWRQKREHSCMSPLRT
jgi:hypothetical protein